MAKKRPELTHDQLMTMGIAHRQQQAERCIMAHYLLRSDKAAVRDANVTAAREIGRRARRKD